MRGGLVDFFVSLVATHLANGILEHGVLLIEVIDSLLVLRVVVHRRLEEEAQEALNAIATSAGGEVREQTEVKAERSGEDRVAAEEVNLDLHGIAHPSEDVDVVPSLLVVVAWRIVVDAHLVVVLCVLVVAVSVEVGLNVGLEDSRKSR